MSEDRQQIELIKNLSNALGVALEMAFEPAELRRIWTEEIDYLAQAKVLLQNRGVEVPEVINNLIRVSEAE